MAISIHQHFNLRKICDLELSSRILDELETPRPETLGQPHVVTLPTVMGPLILFRVLGNGIPYVVTPMPQVALAVAGGKVTTPEATPAGIK